MLVVFCVEADSDSPPVDFCVRSSLTVGGVTSAVLGAGVVLVGTLAVGMVLVGAGAGVVLAGVVEVDVGLGVLVVSVVVVGVVSTVLVGAVLAGGVSAVLVVPVTVSAPSAPPVSGPPRPAAVNPPPASAETSARRSCRRERIIRGLLGPCSSYARPMVVVVQVAHDHWASHTPIHIGRQAEFRKGFVIALDLRKLPCALEVLSGCHGAGISAVPEAQRRAICVLRLTR